MKKITVLDLQQFASQEKQKQFYTNTIESHLITSHKNIHKPHKHNFYLAVLFTHGSGIHEIDFKQYDVFPGTIFFLNPGQIHHWELSEDIKGFIFFHTQSFYDLHFSQSRVNSFPFFSSVQNSPMLKLNKGHLAYFTSLFEQIYTENQSTEVLKMDKTIALINLLYIESTRQYLQMNESEVIIQSAYSVRFQELEQLIEKNYKIEKSPAQYADWLNISAKHLNRITQNTVGKTTTDIILERVFLEAKRELISHKYTFNEIATNLGYADYAYFSRLFKKKNEETPSQFIKRYQ